MPACGRHFEGAFCGFLALDVGEVQPETSGFQDLRLWPREHLRALEMIGKLNERRRRNDLHVGAGPRRFRPARGRTHQAVAARVGAYGGWQDPGDRRDRAVQPQFTQDGKSGQAIVWNGADRGHQAERDRQVVVTALLGQVGRCQIDGDTPCRQRQARSRQSRADTLAGLGDRLVGQSDDGESRQTSRDLDLDIDGPYLDAFERDRGYPLDHRSPHPAITVSHAAAAGDCVLDVLFIAE